MQCEVVLPEKMCGPDGVRIEEETTINGITVTPQQLVAHYGTYDEYGNLAWAVVRLGKAGSFVETSGPIAFVIRTKKVRRSDGQIVGGRLWPKGTIGISPLGSIDADGKVISPLAAIPIPDGLNRGYVIGGLGAEWKTCTIEDGTCPEVPALSIGVDPRLQDGWKFALLNRADRRFNFPTLTACLILGKVTECKPALFDTGNSTIMVAGRSDKPLKKGVAVKMASIGKWDFETRYSPEVEFVEGLEHHIIGIRFFEDNYLLVDADARRMGLSIGGK